MTAEPAARVVLVTTPDATVAEQLVRTLLDEGIIDCGSIVPGLDSIYRWQGQVERSAEVLLILKTTAAEVARLVARVPELHPYDVPEVLVLPVLAGHPPYLQWLGESVGRDVAEGE